MNRPTCQQCGAMPCAINYKRKGKTYYRKTCTGCIDMSRNERSVERQALAKSGYTKRHECDRCHFQAKHASQLSIIYLDGNRLNASRQNLRTYCANCIAEIAAIPNSSRGGLVPDF